MKGVRSALPSPPIHTHVQKETLSDFNEGVCVALKHKRCSKSCSTVLLLEVKGK
jgi:hypothetical protein